MVMIMSSSGLLRPRVGLAGESSVDLCAACVAVFVTYFLQLCADDCAAHPRRCRASVDFARHAHRHQAQVRRQSNVVLTKLFKMTQMLASESPKRSVSRACASSVESGSADYLDDPVDILRCDDESFEYVGALFGLAQLEFGASDHYLSWRCSMNARAFPLRLRVRGRPWTSATVLTLNDARICVILKSFVSTTLTGVGGI